MIDKPGLITSCSVIGLIFAIAFYNPILACIAAPFLITIMVIVLVTVSLRNHQLGRNFWRTDGKYPNEYLTKPTMPAKATDPICVCGCKASQHINSVGNCRKCLCNGFRTTNE